MVVYVIYAVRVSGQRIDYTLDPGLEETKHCSEKRSFFHLRLTIKKFK